MEGSNGSLSDSVVQIPPSLDQADETNKEAEEKQNQPSQEAKQSQQAEQKEYVVAVKPETATAASI